MLLIENNLKADETVTVSSSMVSHEWPFVSEGAANPIVMIELAAQTVEINNSIHRLQLRGQKKR